MTRYSSYPADRSEEVSVVSTGAGPQKAAWSKAGSRLSPVVTQEDSPSLVVEEERQDTVEPLSSPIVARTSSVRAIKQKFENAAANRGEGRKQSLACGSPVAERKKLLQQALYLPGEDVSDESDEVIQTSQSSKEEDKFENKQFQRYRRGQNVAANRRHRQQATRIADRMKLFEKRASDMSQEDATTMSAPTVFDISAPVPEASAPEQERSLAESELSTLDYSFLSDESLNVRDEVEVFSRLQISDSRERDLLGSFQTEDDKEVDAFVATLSPNNRYQGVLHDIVTKYEKETNSTEGPSDDGSPEDAAIQEEKSLAAKGSTRIFVMETRRAEDASPVSMLTSFENEFQAKGSSASRETMKSEGDLQEPQEQEEIQVPFDEPPSEDNKWNIDAVVPLEKQTSDGSPSRTPPNSTLFSTVEQEKEREETDEIWDESVLGDFNAARPSNEDKDWLDTPDHQERQASGAVKQQNGTAFNFNLPRNYSLFNTLEQEEDRESNDGITGGTTDSDGEGKEASWRSVQEKERSPFHTSDPFGYTVGNDNDAVKQVPEASKQTDHVRSTAIETTTGATARRFEISSQREQPPIKGILKNRMNPFTPSAPWTPASPVSSASWYDSSGTSYGTSDVSQQLSPLQSPGLAVPILPSDRFSIGACVNAHLAENPPDGVSEVSSQCSSHQPQQYKSLNPVSAWPHKQERRDSETSSTIFPRDATGRTQALSPGSMDAQHSSSRHSRHENRQDFDEMAQAVTTMAKTASTVVLDVLVEAADKVVVSPLLSIFNCVDQSEGILCQGASAEDCWGAAFSQTMGMRQTAAARSHSSRKKRPTGKKKERKTSRKFKA